MSVLVVIPCLNEANHIGQIIDQLDRDKYVDLIVVADGGSTDGTLNIVKHQLSKSKKLRLLHNNQKIQSAGVNLAVANYGTNIEWLLRVDAHCLYPEDYTKILLNSALESKADSVVVPMITIAENGFQIAVATAQNSVIGTGGSSHRSISSGKFVDHGHHALIKLKLFRNAGGYCEAMPCNEDAELDFRMTKLGGKIWLEPNAAIQYFPRSTPHSLWKQYYKYGIGRASNLQRHKMRPKLRQLLPIFVPLSVALIVLFPLHWLFASPFLFWFSLCMLAGILIGSKVDSRWALLSGFAAAIMHLSWGLGFLRQFIGQPAGVKSQYGLAEKPT